MMIRYYTAVTVVALGLICNAANSQASEPGLVLWAQGSDAEALRWSGADSSVTGLVHSNGGIRVTGTKNSVTGGTEWVTSFDGGTAGPNANQFNPDPLQVATKEWPLSYSLDDYQPGGSAAVAAGSDYVDMTSACEQSGGDQVPIKYLNEDIPDGLFWVPCDVLFDAHNATGAVTVVSTGKVHFKAHQNSQLTAFADGILALTVADAAKAIHLNGSRASLHGFFVAEHGEIHVAGSSQRLECGLLAESIKISGAKLTIDALDCAVNTNVAPLAADDSVATAEDTPVEIDVLANDNDVDGFLDPASIVIVTAPSHGTVTHNPVSGTLTYHPELNFSGIDQFSYTVADDDDAISSPATVTVAVAATNDLPVAVDDSYVTNEDVAIDANVLLNDFDIDGVVDATTVIVVDAPVNGTAVVDPVTGFIAYTPDAEFSGVDTFGYTVADDSGEASLPAIVSITVVFVNDAPIADPQSVTTAEDVPLPITLSGSDPEGEALSFVVITGPSSGVLSGIAPNLIYTPNSDFFGDDSFEFQVNDGVLDSIPALISIAVSPVGGDAPTADSQQLQTDENIALDIVLSGADPDGDAITFELVNGPVNGTLTGIAPDLIYLPNAFYEGADEFTFLTSDGALQSALATVTIDVIGQGNNPPRITSAAIDKHVLVPGTGEAEILDVRDWEQHIYADGHPGFAEWVFNGDGTVATQLHNAPASLLLGPADIGNTRIDGTWRVNTSEDDDYMGFVFGYQNPNQYYLFRWKKKDQSSGLIGKRGMQLHRVDEAENWFGPSTLRETDPGLLFSNRIPWIAFTDYDFSLSFQPGLISITVSQAGTVLESFTVNDSRYTNGRFGFFNLSQKQVQYQGFATERLANRVYVYPVAAEDPDGDAIIYRLLDAPTGMTIDSATGAITWTTDEHNLGDFPVVIEVEDPFGATDQQSFLLLVTDDAPVFVGKPNTVTFADEQYSDKLTAFDPDPQDTLTYSLLDAPVGLTVIPATGELQWLPGTFDLGSHPVSAVVVDSQGNRDALDYVMSVERRSDNQPPVFVTQPPSVATVGRRYQYTPQATDADGDPIQYGLVGDLPYDMQIFDGSNITWIPTADQVTDWTVTVDARDGNNGVAEQTFTIQVQAPDNNNAPNISSQPDINTDVGVAYLYQVIASDADGDALSYQLLQSPPAMTIDPLTGLIQWSPGIADAGFHDIQLRVEDGRGGFADEVYTLAVRDPSVNQAPAISSAPSTQAQPDVEYVYQMIAVDPDGDPLTYSVITVPAGMTIDASGLVRWTPDGTQTGTNPVSLQVADGNGGSATQSYSVFVQQDASDPNNNGPTISSAPGTSIEAGLEYVYAIAANDIDGDVLSYRIAQGPAGMSVDAVGVVRWMTAATDIDVFTVRIEVTDGRGGLAQQGYQLTVFDPNQPPPTNTPPVITSLPPGSGTVDVEYRYDVLATDAEGDSLSYTLLQGPAGMAVGATGILTWTPDIAGDRNIRVSVSDGQNFVEQGWVVQISGSTQNTLPEINSVPPTLGKVSFEYQYAVQASDADGDALNYTLLQGPSGMTVSAAGLVSWTPAAVGNQSIAVRVDDGQAFVTQGWTITVSDADIPLAATISATPTIANLGGTVELGVGYSGAAGAVNISITVDGTPVAVDATGIATVAADTVGLHTATTIVSDMFTSDSASVTYTVIDPNSTSVPPIISLTSPDFEEEITAPRDATGSITDPDGDLLSWFLALQARGAPATEFTTIASGTTEIPNGVIGQIDPTMLINGLYSVILQATDAAGNVSQDTRVIRVTGDLKIGNFSITFEDFSAPVAGLPVTVLRTYDTRRRDESLDFGFGWSVDYQNVRLQESRDIGFSWSVIEEDMGFFSQFCVRPNGDPTVTVRMPDGEVESFVARAEPECTQLVPTVDVHIVFEPTDGTDSTLEQTDFGLLRIIGNSIVDLGATDIPIDPDNYRLTTPAGLIFTLDQSFGIRQVEEPNGSTLTFSDAGIVHSQGFALTFTRDTQGRITAITAPDGTAMTYGYDANGDLTRFTDQVLQNTDYTYQFGTEHYLEDILDPRGIRVSRNEYDAEGRLIAIIDADGHRIEYDHNITGRIETIRDRRGNATVYLYDDEGNVLVETNALGESITRTYDTDRNELSMSNDLGHTTSWSYDERGNQLTETDALLQTTTSTYDNRNLLLSVVDAAGKAVMSNVYDSRNTNLLTLTDALLNTTAFFWDAGIGSGCSSGASLGTRDALLNRSTIQPQCIGPFAELPAYQEDARGVRTSFGYDALGRQTTETSTRTDAFGVLQSLTTTLVYDDKGRVTQVTDPEGNITRTEYNAMDKASASVDANGNRTEFDYDARGHLILTRFPDLSTEITGYDAEGNVTSQTDRQNRTIRMTYDAANRLIETVFPDNTPGNDLDNPGTRNEYDTAGRLTATMDERGNRTVFEYDTAGRRTLVRDALLQETRFEYDVRGLRTAMIDAGNRRTEFVYDVAGRLTETIFPDDTPADQTDNLRSTTGYDALGRKTADTDLAGLTTGFEYDEIGNLTAVIDALTQRTAYGYDEQSNKISQTDAALKTTSRAYDNLGRVTSRTLPESQRETFSYDNNGNRTGHVDFNGAMHSFGYDNLSRQTTANYADGVIVTTAYTPTGQVESVTDDRGATGFSYDERERLINISYPNGKSIGYGYDNTGNRISLNTANQSLSYTFDVLNRLATVTDEAGTTTYGYDAVGNRASIDNANGTSTGYVYDELNRLTELNQFDALNTIIDRHSYVLGPNGNRTRHAELNGRAVDYTYDDLYRLTEETVTDATLGNRTTGWSYDAVGNRLTQTNTGTAGTTITTYVYDSNDRLISEMATGSNPASTVYSYDNNGNTLTKFDGTSTTTYAYDSRNRLQNLNSGQVTYQYDATGIRQSETAASLTTHYLTDPNRDFAQVIEESFDLNAFAEVKYSYGDDLIAQHRRIDATTTNSSTYHYDGIGSTRELTDESGNVTDTYAFTAFGEAEGSTGFTTNDYLYTGEQLDPNLGFYYLRARYYNAGIGRFHSMDTFQGRMFDPVTLHKYLYANGDPVGMIDPSGEATLQEFAAGVKTATILTLKVITILSLADAIYNESGVLSDLVVSLVLADAGGPAGLAAQASDPNAAAVVGSLLVAGSPQKHHTIPIYLCGSRRKQTLSSLPRTEHALIHAQLYGLRVSAILGQELTIKRILRRPTKKDKNGDRLLLAKTSAGRAALVTAISYIYETGDWFGKGSPSIGTVFPVESRRYVLGQTSLPSCKR